MSKQSMTGRGWQATRLRVLNRDGWACSWPTCQKPLEGADATIDHIVPVSLALAQGWTREEINADTNLVAMCRKHNGMKRDLVVIRTDYRNPRWFTNNN